MNQALHIIETFIVMCQTPAKRGRPFGVRDGQLRERTRAMVEAMCYGASNNDVAERFGITKQAADYMRRRHNVCAPIPLTLKCGRNRARGTGKYDRRKDAPNHHPQGPVAIGDPASGGRGRRTDFPGILRSLNVGEFAVAIRNEMPTSGAMHALANRNRMRIRLTMIDDTHLKITRVE